MTCCQLDPDERNSLKSGSNYRIFYQENAVENLDSLVQAFNCLMVLQRTSCLHLYNVVQWVTGQPVKSVVA